MTKAPDTVCMFIQGKNPAGERPGFISRRTVFVGKIGHPGADLNIRAARIFAFVCGVARRAVRS